MPGPSACYLRGLEWPQQGGAHEPGGWKCRPPADRWVSGPATAATAPVSPLGAAVPPVPLQRDVTDDFERHPDDTTHITACDCVHWLRGSRRSMAGRSACAAAVATIVGGRRGGRSGGNDPNEYVVEGDEEIVFDISDRRVARSSLTRI
ncbi:hypothetical protein DL766_005298 [Monosporascus sp. MC13-8B]|uniref:Uncharacterized protein n=1 Tax=Monosporascus cannonballus TaxID=155416 RepID=A0ABY0GSI2_9PEZI|nr:hypothetical protein DL762_010036 [Monosporascus cannonballus]RYO76779.1 hypothetical protein DL763_010166 [Monosporascus cannonballus]RYP29565.1 hypothetical protein DL766_005298 [Monosporascus sp. MC13-8B]